MNIENEIREQIHTAKRHYIDWYRDISRDIYINADNPDNRKVVKLLEVVKYLTKVAKQNNSKWSGGQTSATNINETLQREALVEVIDWVVNDTRNFLYWIESGDKNV